MDQKPNQGLDLEAIREKLRSGDGPVAWQSIEELAETPEFIEYLEREFPRQAAPWFGGIDRREFLKLMGASLALAGLAACRPQSIEKIVPYVRVPEDAPFYEEEHYATTLTLGGFGFGALAEAHNGRPTKVDGNPKHPSNRGTSNIWMGATVLGLYDPDRSKNVVNLTRPSTWDEFNKVAHAELERQKSIKGAGIRILTETVTSPTLTTQVQDVLKAYPSAKWYSYEPANRDNMYEGAEMFFGMPAETLYSFDKADIILSLDCDFINSGPGHLRYAGDFANKRRARQGKTDMNRLYVVESGITVTGTMADHRLAVKAGDVFGIAQAIAAAMGVGGGAAANEHAEYVAAVAQDLKSNSGRSIVVVGDHQPPEVHALAHAMNAALGNVGKTVAYTEPIPASGAGGQAKAIATLTDELRAGTVDLLLIIGGNPAFTAPRDLGFSEALRKATFTVHLSLYQDETSSVSRWHLPMGHELETWGDARAFDGTASITQPLIEPLYDGKSAIEMMAGLFTKPADGYDLVRAYWQKRGMGEDFEKEWKRALNSGVIPGTAAPKITPAPGTIAPTSPGSQPGVELNFRPDPTILDGRYANNAWLQELPKPIHKITWDNAIIISPKMADSLRATDKNGALGGNVRVPVAELKYAGNLIKGPVWVAPGQPEDVITIFFGDGRTMAGNVGNGVGFDGYILRNSQTPWFGSGAELTLTGETYEMACTQQHYSMESRNLVKVMALEAFETNPKEAMNEEEGPGEINMYPDRQYTGNRWAMSIDTGVCTGCAACIIACQSENNFPIVGKEQVMRGREMHWLRVDRYYIGSIDAPDTVHIPVPCMQCELAPCEVVCPVAATSHNSEGLNDMVYNRCVGTRYCSNNCPYKVRRFNFRHYADNVTSTLPSPKAAPVLQLVNNPDVTVRGRGVMEKCTYCVQRINAARKKAAKENRPIKDGEIVTACQVACPTQAIVFGNLSEDGSRVNKLKAEPHNYSLLAELNTRPRTTYLATVVNPSPGLPGDMPKQGDPKQV
jgi:molybdopterin-containing oxidoreductase family iron-sulfur binding subunit